MISDTLPTLALDPATLAVMDADLGREWLIANGLGGYALGSACGAATRSYSGLLVAAVRPPTERAVLVAKVDEIVTLPNGTALALGTNEYADGTIYPRGFEHLADFALEGQLPRWRFRLADRPEVAALEKRVWMEHGRNLTFVQYRHLAADLAAPPIALALTPFCLDRDHHGVTRESDGTRFTIAAEAHACTVRASTNAHPYRLIAGPTAAFTPDGDWNRSIRHRIETERGLPDVEDAFMPGTFAVSLQPGEAATLVLAAEAALPDTLAGLGGPDHERLAAAALERERRRQRVLLDRAGPRAAVDDFFARLVLAADQFLVARPNPRAAPPVMEAIVDASLSTPGLPAALQAAAPPPSLPPDTTDRAPDPAVTVIAGYPWFTDWGRDTMIALPGLTLATGRHAEARGLLRTFARYADQGMIPNRFPDAGTQPEYNTVDATLWYFVALDRYLADTQDWSLLDELFPLLADVVVWHQRGTRYGIGVDPADGLLRAGAPGVQLTWMDAKVDDWVVTPRSGKPVEINALWYRALALMSAWARRLGAATGAYDGMRAAIERSFAARFWYPAGGYLYDVVDADGEPGKLDWSLRPNQILALAVAPELLSDDQARSILAAAERTLLTPLGLRTLAPDDLRFTPRYAGDRRARDAAYHQGTAWPWLLGAYADARQRLGGDATSLRALLDPFRAHLAQAGLGTISEIADAAPPFAPRGCPAQAWSVAELLRLASSDSQTEAEF
jgi:glycogen debranching enzyme